MSESKVTTDMLYEFLKQFRSEFLEFKGDVNRRFEQIDRRFEQLERSNAELRDEIRRDKEKLDKVYESRDKVTVQFTRAWMGASFFIALFTLIGGFALAKTFA